MTNGDKQGDREDSRLGREDGPELRGEAQDEMLGSSWKQRRTVGLPKTSLGLISFSPLARVCLSWGDPALQGEVHR